MNISAIFILIFGFVLQCVKSDDLGIGLWLCHGEKHGTLLPNPFDCGLYYVCDGTIPLIKKCDAGLHFDPIRHVCNWPEAANCQLGIELSTTESPKSTEVQTERPTTTSTKEPETTRPSTTTPKITTTTTQSSTTMSTTTEALCTTFGPSTALTTMRPIVPPFMGAYDKESGLPISSMTGFNISNVQCLHYGLYFLPHPFKCDTYYICSQEYLHLHHCGSGVHWNYKKEQCEISVISRCYYKDALANGTITTKMPFTSESTTATTTTPRSTTSTLSTRPPQPPTPPTHSQSAEPTTGTTLEVLTTQTQNDIDQEILPKCPSDRRAYYPHPFDCRKYYNCIGGIPILTICPNNLYWNEVENSCTLPEYTICKSDQNKTF